MLIFSPFQKPRKVNTYPETLQWVNNLEFALQIATCPHLQRLTGFSVIRCPGFPCHPLPTPTHAAGSQGRRAKGSQGSGNDLCGGAQNGDICKLRGSGSGLRGANWRRPR